MAKKLTPIERAVLALGGPSKAATALGIENPSVVFNWISRGRVPAHRVMDLATASGVSAQELRPDMFTVAA